MCGAVVDFVSPPETLVAPLPHIPDYFDAFDNPHHAVTRYRLDREGNRYTHVTDHY